MVPHSMVPPERAAADDPRLGLCARCRHARRLDSDRGSTFLLCQLALTDDRFPKYPRLPVRICEGYQPQAEPGI